MGQLHIVDHPLIQHKLSLIREKDTGSKDFRQILEEISLLLGYEVLRDLELGEVEIETPLCKTVQHRIVGKKLAIVAILRAGLGMVHGIQTLVPVAKVGFIGMSRDEETHVPTEYYCKLPPEIDQRFVLLCDPMLATGGSACDAIADLKAKGCRHIRLMCLVAAPEGVRCVQKEHPDVQIFVAALDERLNEDAYIVPGLGDAGDRIFGTV